MTKPYVYMKWSDDGLHIRKWSPDPFEGGIALYAEVPAVSREGVLEALLPFAELVDDVKESASALQNDRDDFYITQVGGYKIGDLYTSDFIRAAEAYRALSTVPASEPDAGWMPAIGQEVRASESMAENWPDWRDVRLWVVGVSLDRNVTGNPTRGLNVTISDEWPVTNRTGGFTDGFYIGRDYAPDDLVPLPTPPGKMGEG